jgi:predicted RNA-binding protein with PIN domain
VRPRPGRRGPRGDGGLSPGPAPELRPALDAALDIARAGLGETPPVDPPRLLRRLLNFTRLNNQALATIRRALDDDAFRARVAERAGDEESLGRPAWLLLNRPDGWEQELAALTTPAGEPRGDGPEARDLRRRLERSEAALAKAQAELAAAKVKATQAAERASASSRDKRQADTEMGRLRVRLQKAEEERDRAEQRAEQAAASAARPPQSRPGPESAPPPPPPDPWAGVDRGDVADRVSGLARDLAEVSSRLGDLARLLEPAAPRGRPARKPRPDPKPRRQPARLPPAVFDTAVEAGDHLLRAGVLLLVDGYNMTISSWPGMAIPDQRDRLVDALCELAARTHCDVHVVFDGAEVQPAPVAPPRTVRVSFTPEDIEADDRILELIEAEPVARTVVVASDDQRVRQGASERGANVLSGQQLFHSMRRER